MYALTTASAKLNDKVFPLLAQRMKENNFSIDDLSNELMTVYELACDYQTNRFDNDYDSEIGCYNLTDITFFKKIPGGSLTPFLPSVMEITEVIITWLSVWDEGFSAMGTFNYYEAKNASDVITEANEAFEKGLQEYDAFEDGSPLKSAYTREEFGNQEAIDSLNELYDGYTEGASSYYSFRNNNPAGVHYGESETFEEALADVGYVGKIALEMIKFMIVDMSLSIFNTDWKTNRYPQTEVW